MKYCILTPRFPFPENGGDVLRINNIAKYLKSAGHELILVSFCEGNPDMAAAETLYDKIYVVKRKKTNSMLYSLEYMLSGRPIQCGYYYSREYSKLLGMVIAKEKPDRFVSHLLRMVPYLTQHGVESQSIVEMTDALSKTYTLSSGFKGMSLKKVIYAIERKLIKRYERFVMKKFPKVVLVSQADIDYLSAEGDKHSLALYTNGVECMDEIPNSYDHDKICFVGNMRTLQNQDAVLHFVNYIFPLILKKKPGAKFYIVGAEPPRNIMALSEKYENVVVTGFVDVLSDAVKDSCVAVAPVKIAAGIQNKVIVAMGMGVPVVMSSLISRAIPELVSGTNCIIEDADQAFADACMRMMENETDRNHISRSGYDTVRKYYSWQEKLSGYDLLNPKCPNARFGLKAKQIPSF